MRFFILIIWSSHCNRQKRTFKANLYFLKYILVRRGGLCSTCIRGTLADKKAKILTVCSAYWQCCASTIVQANADFLSWGVLTWPLAVYFIKIPNQTVNMALLRRAVRWRRFMQKKPCPHTCFYLYRVWAQIANFSQNYKHAPEYSS